jgi:hypothetical protein
VLAIANNDTDSLTMFNTAIGSATALEDRAPFHYMERISSLAFEPGGFFATCQESRNTYDDLQVANDFMGPTLYGTTTAGGASSSMVTSRAQPCDPANPATTCFLTHYDMLHETPMCMGIAHDTETLTPFRHVYWVFDGLARQLVRLDFQEPHGPGSLDHSMASVRRFEDVQLTPVAGVPGHIMMDPVARVLYIADTGANRVLRVDPDSGQFVRNARHNFSIYSSMSSRFEYSIYSCTSQHVFASGIDRPSGLVVDQHYVYVGEYGTGRILVLEKASGRQVSYVATGAQGLMGLEMSGGQLWYTDGPGNEVGKVVVDAACPSNSHQVSAAVASAVAWSPPVCSVTVLTDTDADRERFHHEAFLNTHNASNFPANYPSNYSTMTAAQCPLVNFDILLMEGFLCHVCLPDPCRNGGTCVHHSGRYTLGGFSCNCPAGYSGDVCQLGPPPPPGVVRPPVLPQPAPPPAAVPPGPSPPGPSPPSTSPAPTPSFTEVGAVMAEMTVDIDIAQYTPDVLSVVLQSNLATLAGVHRSQIVIMSVNAGSIRVRFKILSGKHSSMAAVTPTQALAKLKQNVASGATIAGAVVLGDVKVTSALAQRDPSPVSANGEANDDDKLPMITAIVCGAVVALAAVVALSAWLMRRSQAERKTCCVEVKPQLHEHDEEMPKAVVDGLPKGAPAAVSAQQWSAIRSVKGPIRPQHAPTAKAPPRATPPRVKTPPPYLPTRELRGEPGSPLRSQP